MKIRNNCVTCLAISLSIHVCYSQNTNKVYISHGLRNGTTACYGVTVPDSSYVRTDYGCGVKKKWREYGNWNSEISSGMISKQKGFYSITEYRNDMPVSTQFKVKLTNRRIIFLGEKDYKYIPRGMKLRRIRSL
jgi:hypothetical protein